MSTVAILVRNTNSFCSVAISGLSSGSLEEGTAVLGSWIIGSCIGSCEIVTDIVHDGMALVCKQGEHLKRTSWVDAHNHPANIGFDCRIVSWQGLLVIFGGVFSWSRKAWYKPCKPVHQITCLALAIASYMFPIYYMVGHVSHEVTGTCWMQQKRNLPSDHVRKAEGKEGEEKC